MMSKSAVWLHLYFQSTSQFLILVHYLMTKKLSAMTWEWSLKCVIIKLIYNVESLGLVYHPLNVPGKDNKTGLILDTTLYYGQF